MASDLVTNPRAPTLLAAAVISVESCIVNINTGILALRLAISRVASRPFIVGMETSMTIASGFNCSAKRTASWPFSASPQISHSGRLSRMRRIFADDRVVVSNDDPHRHRSLHSVTCEGKSIASDVQTWAAEGSSDDPSFRDITSKHKRFSLGCLLYWLSNSTTYNTVFHPPSLPLIPCVLRVE